MMDSKRMRHAETPKETHEVKGFTRNEKRKIGRICVLCYINCLRLHEDSILLFSKGRLSSSYALSVVASEEMGKYVVLSNGLFYEHFDIERNWGQKILDSTYSHKMKQRAFINRRWHEFYPKVDKLEKMMEDLEERKQSALYVGLPKKNGHADIKGKITNPFRVNKKEIIRQITFVNDYLLLEALGVRKGGFTLDFEELKEIMTKALVKSLHKAWPLMGREARIDYNQLVRLPDYSELEEAQ